MNIPNWLRIVLLVLSLASFVPQLRLLWTRRDSSGISLYYILFNLLVATELFTIDLALLTSTEGGEVFIHMPASTGDWINLAQFAAVWVSWVAIFINCIIFYPHDQPQTTAISAIYTSYLLISLVPVFIVLGSTGSEEDHRWFDALFLGFHTYFLNPLITIIGITALYPQVCTILNRPRGSGLGALSLLGLATQAVLFILLGITWPGRLVWPYPVFGHSFITWFQMVGYVPSDYFIFAVVQAILFFVAVRYNDWHLGVDEGQRTGETESLL